MSGGLVGHCSIVGWLRVACGNWLAVRITHCRQLPYMNFVDCGPWRLAVWRELQGEAAEFGISVLGALFLEVDSVVGKPGVESEVVELGGGVWVKPPQAGCTTQCGRGVVTGVNPGNNVYVNGMPWHVLDVRRVVGLEEESVAGDDKGGHGP